MTAIELRFDAEGQVCCEFGSIPTPPAAQITWDHSTNSTTLENVHPVILVSREFADNPDTPTRRMSAAVTTFRTDGDRRFMTIRADNGTWTWELFEAFWWDGLNCTLYVGRWPD